MKAKSVLLEPTFDFRIELPTENLGRAMTDIDEMGGSTNAPEIYENSAILTGNCPVATMRSYATRLRAFTKGEGRITMQIGPYKPCHNAEEVIAERGYSPELDERNTPNSVFCKNGSGYVVPWNEADALMHVKDETEPEEIVTVERVSRPRRVDYRGTVEEDKELMRIFEATYGKIKPRKVSEKVENSAPETKEKVRKNRPRGEDYVIIDGYNMIFAWEFLRRYAEMDISLARDILIRIMCSYSAFRRCKCIIVFDAYKRSGGEGSEEDINGVSVVYTRENETADAYVEKTTSSLAEKHTVRVVTSDLEEQRIVLGSGGLRVSTREFALELEKLEEDIREIIESIR
jgi:predicted RNA-binding protein with PIN domain